MYKVCSILHSTTKSFKNSIERHEFQIKRPKTLPKKTIIEDAIFPKTLPSQLFPHTQSPNRAKQNININLDNAGKSFPRFEELKPIYDPLIFFPLSFI